LHEPFLGENFPSLLNEPKTLHEGHSELHVQSLRRFRYYYFDLIIYHSIKQTKDSVLLKLTSGGISAKGWWIPWFTNFSHFNIWQVYFTSFSFILSIVLMLVQEYDVERSADRQFCEMW